MQSMSLELGRGGGQGGGVQKATNGEGAVTQQEKGDEEMMKR